MAAINTIYKSNNKILARLSLIALVLLFFFLSYSVESFNYIINDLIYNIGIEVEYFNSLRISSAIALANSCNIDAIPKIYIASWLIALSIPINLVSFII